MISKDFWQSNFWKKCRTLPLMKQAGSFYRFGIKAKHFLLSKILCPYYSFAAKNKSVQKDPYEFGDLYVSLTSYPARINEAYYAICSVLSQTSLPNKILLTLTTEEFPNKEKDIPDKILSLQAKGLEFIWAEENLKPHNKYFYAMQKYPSATIITADDDILYPRNTIKKLLKSYKAFPHAISALCTNKIFYNNERILPYSQVAHCYDMNLMNPRFDLAAEGFAGVLYPPSVLPEETFKKDQIKKCSPIADDLWLKAMELINNVPVVCAAKYKDPTMIQSVQSLGLFNKNSGLAQNDIQLEKIVSEYKNKGLLNNLK